MKKLLVTTAIVLSLAGNIAIAADTAAKTDTVKTEDHGSTKHHAKMDAALSKLPKDKQELFKNTMEANYEANKENHDKLRSLHKEMKDLMVAPTFDKKAYTGKAAEALAIEDKIHTSNVEAIASLAEKFSVDERKILAKAEHYHMGKMKHIDSSSDVGKVVDSKK